MATTQNSPFKHSVLEPADTNQAAAQLQDCLVILIDLSLSLKQLHWNVVGKHFRSVHLQLDEIIDSARNASDEVAERISTLGVAPDGRASTVAQRSDLSDVPANFVKDQSVLELTSDLLKQTIEQLRRGIEKVGELDAMSEDLLVGICRELEKHLWMVQAHLA